MTGPQAERIVQPEHVQTVRLRAQRWPVAPKAYGALGGAGTGAAIAAIIVGLIQDYVTHGPLSAPAIQAIYAVVPFVLAFAGAWLAPHQPRPAAPRASPETRTQVEWGRDYIQRAYGGEAPPAPPAAPETKDS